MHNLRFRAAVMNALLIGVVPAAFLVIILTGLFRQGDPTGHVLLWAFIMTVSVTLYAAIGGVLSALSVENRPRLPSERPASTSGEKVTVLAFVLMSLPIIMVLGHARTDLRHGLVAAGLIGGGLILAALSPRVRPPASFG